MGKIDGYEFRGMPQEVIDFKDQVIEKINYGKVANPSVNAVPTWKGDKGESAWIFQGDSGWLYVCTSTGTATWKKVVYFVTS